MKKLLVFLGLLCGIIAAQTASAESRIQYFCDQVSSPIEILICYDPTVKALDHETERMYRSVYEGAAEGKRSELRDEQVGWLKQRKSDCHIPDDEEDISAEEALRDRQCLVQEYRERIAKLAKLSAPAAGRLSARPKVLTDTSAYFAIVSSRNTEVTAQEELARLQHSYSFERFELYPPYKNDVNWHIVIASYTDRDSAAEARDFAVSMGIAEDAFVWRIPDLQGSPDSDFGPSTLNTAQQRFSSVANAVLKCYNKQVAGNATTTIRKLYDCAGYWVTPRTLLLCGIAGGTGNECPALPDTIEGRAIRDANLKELNLTLDSNLLLNADYLPHLPSSDQIKNCNANSKDQPAFKICSTSSISQYYNKLIRCFGAMTDGEKLACFTNQTNNADFQFLVGCLGGGRPSADKISTCTSKDLPLEQQVSDIHHCIIGAVGDRNAQTCVTTTLNETEQQVISCIESPSGDSDPAKCIEDVSPSFKRARAVGACLDLIEHEEKGTAASCLSDNLDFDSDRLANCMNEANGVAIGACLLGKSNDLAAVQRIASCLDGGRVASAVIASCTDGILDHQSAQRISCVVAAGDSREKLIACAAAVMFPPETARVIGCATDSDGPTSFALCVASPQMNEEWRIAAECAVANGGDPVGFAGCTAGRLTIRELTKCFQGQVGKDCFGPNNTIVTSLNNAFNDVTRGPGKNNEIVKAIASIEKIAGGPNSVINNPHQVLGGKNSVFNNPRQILGGDHSVFHDPGQIINPGRWRF